MPTPELRIAAALERIADALEDPPAPPPLVKGPMVSGGRELSERHVHVWVTTGFGPTYCLFCHLSQPDDSPPA